VGAPFRGSVGLVRPGGGREGAWARPSGARSASFVRMAAGRARGCAFLVVAAAAAETAASRRAPRCAFPEHRLSPGGRRSVRTQLAQAGRLRDMATLLPAEATKLAETQYGVVSRRQLLRELSPSQVKGRVRHGRLVVVERGVYRVPGGAVVPQQRPFAAALRSGDGATLTGPFVLGHLGVDGFRDTVGDRRLRLAFDWMRWNGLVSGTRLSAHLAALAEQADPGAHAVLDALGATGTAPESDGERQLGGALCRFSPPPEPQVWVTPRRRVDWYFRALRYGFEYLGGVDHGAVAGRIDDDERDRELRAEGIRLVYVTAADLAESTTLLGTIASTLTVRAHELGVPAPALRS
jgi:hypothetical protein